VKTDDVDITEIVELSASKVSGVTAPANATPFLLLKAAAAGVCSTCKGAGTILNGNRECPDCDGPAEKSDVDTETVAIEEKVTGDDADNDGAEKGAVQDALDGTATPQESGHLASGQSALAGPVAATAKPAVPAAQQEGGASSYEIPDEAKLKKADAVASLVEAIKVLDTQRAAIKDGIAAIADAEGEAGEATKAGKVLSSKNVAALEAAHKHLSSVIETAKIKASPPASETADKEIFSMADVTKAELADSIVAGVKAAFKQERDAEQAELAEKAEKLEQAKQLVAADLAEKGNVSGGDNTGGTQSNNAGEITEAAIKPTKETDADDVNAVKEGEVTKSEDTPDEFTKQVETQLEALTKGQNALQELVSKIAKRPRPGGPSLDGQGRGIAPAAEGRLSDATKSEGDEIEKLTKSLDEATDPLQKSDLGLKLTYARLAKAHETGQL
jgi:hypothetical protein